MALPDNNNAFKSSDETVTVNASVFCCFFFKIPAHVVTLVPLGPLRLGAFCREKRKTLLLISCSLLLIYRLLVRM